MTSVGIDQSSGETESTFQESSLRTAKFQRVRLEHGEQGTLGSLTLWLKPLETACDLALCRTGQKSYTVAQRVKRNLKGHLLLQMEGSCPVMLTPARITGSHLKCQLASDCMVPWPQTCRLCYTDMAWGPALALESLGSRSCPGFPAY